MTDAYIKGSRLLHKPAEDEGPSLAWMGLPKAAVGPFLHLHAKLQGEVTPCAGRQEWTSNSAADKATAIRLCGDCPAKAACLEFATVNNERGGNIWGGKEF